MRRRGRWWRRSFPACASAQGPPREQGVFRPADLVELAALDPSVKLDVRYATTNNFLGRAVYTEARAFLQREPAEALLRAHRALREKGYGLLVFDAYRPWSVTKLFWDLTPPAKRDFVANPRVGSKHNRGTAVDLTLYALATGREAEMPSPYDEFSERAHPAYAGGTPEARARRDLLRAAMEARRLHGRAQRVVALQLERLAVLSDPGRAVPLVAHGGAIRSQLYPVGRP